jgi:hypothetical protein
LFASATQWKFGLPQLREDFFRARILVKALQAVNNFAGRNLAQKGGIGFVQLARGALRDD